MENESVWVYLHVGSGDIGDYQLSGMPENAHCLFGWANGICTQNVEVNAGRVNLPAFGVLIFAASEA